jgi:hypothetical protein
LGQAKGAVEGGTRGEGGWCGCGQGCSLSQG